MRKTVSRIGHDGAIHEVEVEATLGGTAAGTSATMPSSQQDEQQQPSRPLTRRQRRQQQRRQRRQQNNNTATEFIDIEAMKIEQDATCTDSESSDEGSRLSIEEDGDSFTGIEITTTASDEVDDFGEAFDVEANPLPTLAAQALPPRPRTLTEDSNTSKRSVTFIDRDAQVVFPVPHMMNATMSQRHRTFTEDSYGQHSVSSHGQMSVHTHTSHHTMQSHRSVHSTSGESTATPTTGLYAKNVWQVLTCKFVLREICFNMIASGLTPTCTFYLIFDYFGEGPYYWNDSACFGVLMVALWCSPLLIFLLMPSMIPDAIRKGWFLRLRMEDVDPRIRRVLPFLGEHWFWDWPLRRHMCMGLIIGSIYVPTGLFMARFVIGPKFATTWTLIMFDVCYVVCLAVPVTALGLLGYSVEHHLDDVLERMSTDPIVSKRIAKRAGSSVKLQCCFPCFPARAR